MKDKRARGTETESRHCPGALSQVQPSTKQPKEEAIAANNERQEGDNQTRRALRFFSGVSCSWSFYVCLAFFFFQWLGLFDGQRG